MKTWHVLGQMLKVGEGGGLTQRDIRVIAHTTADCEVQFEPSPLVGHFQVVVVDTRDKRKIRRLSKALWG